MRNLIPRFICEQYKRNVFQGQFNAVTMFVDLFDFTSITEKLMGYGKQGAETLSFIVNSVFDKAIKKVYAKNGYICSFGGDSFTAVFPTEADLAAYLVARDIEKIFRTTFHEGKLKNAKYTDFKLLARIGLACGEVQWGIVGSGAHKTFYFRGEAISSCISAAKLAGPGEVFIDSGLYSTLGPMIEKMQADESFKETEKKVKSLPVPEKVASCFFPTHDLSTIIGGEFRDVVSVFLSFKDSEKYEDLNRFVTGVLELADRMGGFFNALYFADKGPSMLVLFGAPRSYENNVQRALDFALTLKKISNLEIRAGITSGTVYAGFVGGQERCTYSVLGDTVNIAARFMASCDWGGMWVSRNIYEKAGEEYEIEAHGALAFKGKSRPVGVFELHGRSGEKEYAFRGEMVGREAELEAARNAVKEAISGRFAGITYLHGDAGTGKSRLLFELLQDIKPRCQIFLAKSDSVVQKSLQPFVNALKEQLLVSSPGVELDRQSFEKVWGELTNKLSGLGDKRAVLIAAELSRTRSIIAGLLGLEYPDSLYEKLDAQGKFENSMFALKEYFKAISLLKPLCIILEDIQWLDLDSGRLVTTLTRKIDDFPMVIFASARFDDDGSKPMLSVDRTVLQHNIVLRNLSPQNTRRIAEGELGSKISEGLAGFIFSRTEGNPFYAEQFTRYLAENEFLDSTQTGYELASQVSGIPEGIKPILVARIDRLSAEVKRAVQTASVLGKEFDVAVLSRMLKDENLNLILFKGEEGNIWQPVSELLYIFTHVLLKDAAYDMQLRSSLRLLHASAAEAIKTLYNDEPPRYSDLAFHYERAERIEDACFYLRKAAVWAKDNFYNQEAIDLFTRLLVYLDNEAEKIDIRNTVGEVLRLIGRWDDAAEVFRKNLVAAERVGADRLVAESSSRLGELLRYQGRYDEALDYLNRSQEKYARLEDRHGLCSALAQIGGVCWDKGEYVEAVKHYKRRLELARKMGDALEVSRAENSLGAFHVNQGEYEKAMKCYQSYLETAQGFGDRKAIMDAIGNMGGVYFYQGDFTNALKCFQRKREIAEELGDRHELGTTAGNIGFIYDELGNYDKALQCYKTQFEITEELGDKPGMGNAIGNMGNVFYYQDNSFRAMECYKAQLEIAEELGDQYGISVVAANVGVLYQDRGEVKKAEKYYNRAIDLAKKQGLTYELSGYLSNLANLLYSQKRIDEAREVNRQAIALAHNVKREDIIFSSRLLEAKIVGSQNSKDGAKALEGLLDSTDHDERRADIYYELFKFTGKEKYRNQALDIYGNLGKKAGTAALKNRIRELKEKRGKGTPDF